MTTLATTNLTLADIAAQTQDQKIMDIGEILNATNEIIGDMSWVECNDGTQHKSAIRTGIPTPTWRKLYGGIGSTKSTTAPVVDACGMLEDLAEADVDLIDKSPDPGKVRLNEARAHIEGMSQTYASTLFYGDQAINKERFTGLAPRFNALSTSGNSSGYNVINGAASGSDNTSIWLILWDENTVSGLYPRGSKAGLSHQDEGMDWVLDPADSTKKYKVYRDHFKWDCGLYVKDWRYIVRIANIDVSDLNTLANTKLLVQWMTQATERLPQLGMGRGAFYCNRNIREKLRLGILQSITTQLTWETVAGKRVMMFDEFPVRRCDAILNTETLVS
jgi:hypothetical protein